MFFKLSGLVAQGVELTGGKVVDGADVCLWIAVIRKSSVRFLDRGVPEILVPTFGDPKQDPMGFLDFRPVGVIFGVLLDNDMP